MTAMTIQDIIDESQNDIGTFQGRIRIVDGSGILHESPEGIEGGAVDGLLTRELLAIRSTIIRSDNAYAPDEPCVVLEIKDE